MNRRESFKSILLGAVAGAAITTQTGCKSGEEEIVSVLELPAYGRTPAEKEHDAEVLGTTFFTDHEMATIRVLCDIILPATPTAVSAVEAEVPEFLEFIVKDLPTYHELPLRGGLMWLDHKSNTEFGTEFKSATLEQKKQICDQICWHDTEISLDKQPLEIQFFYMMRGLTVTGYYTSKVGIADLGYKGNQPNVWDGVPQDVLDQHGVAYDPEWIAKCIDQSTRGTIATWDENGNLLT